MIKPCFSPQDPDWLALRQRLWPQSAASHLQQMAHAQSDPDSFGVYLAYSDEGEAVGFVEVGLRHEPIGGIDQLPAGFIEGLFVRPKARQKGVARQLIAVAEEWAHSVGCRVLISDVWAGNKQGQKAHKALGFEPGETVIYYHKKIG